MRYIPENYDYLAENAEAQFTQEFHRVSARVIALCWAVAGLVIAGAMALLIWGGR